MEGRLLAAVVIAGASLSGCSAKSPAVQRCEDILLPTLKAPSTYRLIEQTVSLKKPDGTNNVFLTYDAANSYNAPIRAVFWCNFDSRSDVAKAAPESLEVQADNLEVAADAVQANIEAPATSDAAAIEPRNAEELAGAQPARSAEEADADQVPVCDRPESAAKTALMKEIGVDCAPD